MFKGTEDGKIYSKSYKKKVKEIIVTIAMMAVMLLPWIAIDYIYYMRHSFIWAENFVNRCYGMLQVYGITYTSAMDNIGGTVGIIITMVSLFFSTNINLVQRLEKNTFGVTYREIQNIRGGIGQKAEKFTRRMSYLAPFILMPVLNFRLCVTGYLLYFYCCASVLLQYLLYASSFSRDEIPRKVVMVLLDQLCRENNWDVNDIQKFDMRLMAVRRSVKTEENWSEVEVLFETLLQGMQAVNEEKQQLIISHFYRIVCCEQSENKKLMHRIWNLYLKQENQRAAQNIRNGGKNQKKIEIGACFWGMLQGAVYTVTEEELIIFVQDFLNFRQQGIDAYNIKEQSSKRMLKYLRRIDNMRHEDMIVEKVLEEELLSKRCCLLLILLECRFRTEAPVTVKLAVLVGKLKEYGYRELDRMEKSDISSDIFRFVEGAHQQKVIQHIVDEMIRDRQNGENRCCINSFPIL